MEERERERGEGGGRGGEGREREREEGEGRRGGEGMVYEVGRVILTPSVLQGAVPSVLVSMFVRSDVLCNDLHVCKE